MLCQMYSVNYSTFYYIYHQTGWSALMEAVFKARENIALRLIEAGATSHIQDNVSLSQSFNGHYLTHMHMHRTTPVLSF